MKNFIKKLVYLEDVPDSQYGRQWRTIPVVSNDPNPTIGIETQLTKWNNKEIEPRPISGRYFSLVVNPSNWKIEALHDYYDGPICSWQFGPFLYSQYRIGNCEKGLKE